MDNNAVQGQGVLADGGSSMMGAVDQGAGLVGDGGVTSGNTGGRSADAQAFGDATSVSSDQGVALDMMPAGTVVPACADAVFDAVPSVLRGDTSGGADNAGPASCVQSGTDGSNDFVAYFVAPSAGWYRFSTVGSNFDTVLHLRAGGCAGEELGCKARPAGR